MMVALVQSGSGEDTILCTSCRRAGHTEDVLLRILAGHVSLIHSGSAPLMPILCKPASCFQ